MIIIDSIVILMLCGLLSYWLTKNKRLIRECKSLRIQVEHLILRRNIEDRELVDALNSSVNDIFNSITQQYEQRNNTTASGCDSTR